MSNIGAHDNHKLLSYHDNEPLRYDYNTIDIIAHHYYGPCFSLKFQFFLYLFYNFFLYIT